MFLFLFGECSVACIVNVRVVVVVPVMWLYRGWFVVCVLNVPVVMW